MAESGQAAGSDQLAEPAKTDGSGQAAGSDQLAEPAKTDGSDQSAVPGQMCLYAYPFQGIRLSDTLDYSCRA